AGARVGGQELAQGRAGLLARPHAREQPRTVGGLGDGLGGDRAHPRLRPAHDRADREPVRLHRDPDLAASRVPGDDGVRHARSRRRNSIARITRAGAPAAITPAGMSSVTTELAPITQRSPISTPPVTTQLTPNQQLSPILTGPRGTNPCQVSGSSGSS